MEIKDDDFQASASGQTAVDTLGELARERLRQRETTKRLLIGAVTLLFIFAGVIMLFAPEGRQQIGYIIGVVLVILALGAIGASKFVLQVPGIHLNTTNQMTSAAGERASRVEASASDALSEADDVPA